MVQTLNTNEKWLEADIDLLEVICGDAFIELQHACNKFPMFPDKLTHIDLAGLARPLKDMRDMNDANGGEQASAASVVLEEFLEFQQAVLQGDRTAARKELVQTIAMLLRTYIHLEHYCRPV